MGRYYSYYAARQGKNCNRNFKETITRTSRNVLTMQKVSKITFLKKVARICVNILRLGSPLVINEQCVVLTWELHRCCPARTSPSWATAGQSPCGIWCSSSSGTSRAPQQPFFSKAHVFFIQTTCNKNDVFPRHMCFFIIITWNKNIITGIYTPPFPRGGRPGTRGRRCSECTRAGGFPSARKNTGWHGTSGHWMQFVGIKF